jgi:hypothetical protein
VLWCLSEAAWARRHRGDASGPPALIREEPIRRAPLLDRRTTFGLDLAVMGAAFALAYLLRYEFAVPLGELRRVALQFPLVLAIEFVAL